MSNQEQTTATQGTGPIDESLVEGGQIEADLRTASELQTVAGSKLSVEWRPEGAVVGGAKILRSDIACRNGFIHVIDRPVQ